MTTNEMMVLNAFFFGLAAFAVTVPLALAVYIWLSIGAYARKIGYGFLIDWLEFAARLSAQKDDQLKRDIQVVEAGYHLRQRRLELQGRRLELLDSLDQAGQKETVKR